MVLYRARLWAALVGAFVLQSVGVAQESMPAAKSALAVKSKANATVNAAKRKGAPKLVDINSASKKELMTLPFISEERADKIIAGRPYNSKFNLLTRSILSKEVFGAVRKRVEVK